MTLSTGCNSGRARLAALVLVTMALACAMHLAESARRKGYSPQLVKLLDEFQEASGTIDEEKYELAEEFCQKTGEFRENKYNVRPGSGDSREVLKQMLKYIDTPISLTDWSYENGALLTLQGPAASARFEDELVPACTAFSDSFGQVYNNFDRSDHKNVFYEGILTYATKRDVQDFVYAMAHHRCCQVLTVNKGQQEDLKDQIEARMKEENAKAKKLREELSKWGH